RIKRKRRCYSSPFQASSIVVMDISMPVMDGLEATRQILADFPDTPVLILSAYDGPTDIEIALEAGVRGYIVKDTMATELIEAIRSLYKGKRYFGREIADKVDSRNAEDSDS